MNQPHTTDPKEERIIELIPLLVQLGKTADSSVISPSMRLDPWDFGVLWKRWDRVVIGWDANKIANLIKGLTYFEKVFNCGFGSIPPVPQLFGIYASMVSSSERDNFADWILINTVNDHVPYGTSNFGMRSLAALGRKKAALADRKRTNAASEQARLEEAQRNKGQLATEKLPKALRRKDAAAVAALLAKGADVNAPSETGPTARDIAKELGIESWINVESTKVAQ